MIVDMLTQKRITNPEKKKVRGKRSLTGAMVKGSSCQKPRRGRGEKTKTTAWLLFVLQYIVEFANGLFLMRRKINQQFQL
jgi:hypothetical protein